MVFHLDLVNHRLKELDCSKNRCPSGSRNFVSMLLCLLVVLIVLWDMIYIAPKMPWFHARLVELS